MMKILEFLMNPTFSESFANHFYKFGDTTAVILLGTLKMILILAGSLLIISPIIPFIFIAACKFVNIDNRSKYRK